MMSASVEILISKNPLDPGGIAKRAVVPESGGIDIFIGTVRNNTKGKKVVNLEYEAYGPMAKAELSNIISEACDHWELYKIIVHHRVGILTVGEEAVVIGVSAAHRAEAFAGCRYIIEELKKRVPIWKKEIFVDGEVWVSAHP